MLAITRPSMGSWVPLSVWTPGPLTWMDGQDADVVVGPQGTGSAVRHPVPDRKPQPGQDLVGFVQRWTVQPRDEGKPALTAGREPRDVAGCSWFVGSSMESG